MTTMTVETKPLPAGWQRDQWIARRNALLLVPHRPRVLLACEWARRVLPTYEARRPTDRRPATAIHDGRAWVFDPSAENLRMALAAAANAAAHAADAAANAAAYAAYAADAAANAAAANAAAYAADAEAEADLWPWLHRTYQRAIGPAGVVFDPHWRTAEAVGIARGIADALALDRLPILADALEEAGFGHDDTLLAMREEPDTATLADWPLWELLGLGEK